MHLSRMKEEQDSLPFDEVNMSHDDLSIKSEHGVYRSASRQRSCLQLRAPSGVSGASVRPYALEGRVGSRDSVRKISGSTFAEYVMKHCLEPTALLSALLFITSPSSAQNRAMHDMVLFPNAGGLSGARGAIVGMESAQTVGHSHLQSNADFSGVWWFWRIAERLQRDEEPTQAEWDSLFNTPGYAALQARERRRASLTTGFRAALMPSRATQRDSIIATNSWTARVIQHIAPLPLRRQELTTFQDGLVRDDFLGQAVTLVQTLLPPGTVRRFGRPAVAFIFFLPDGRGYPDVIVADLARSASRPNLVPFFAHEATHFYYAALAQEHRRAGRPAHVEALSRLWVKLFEESVGDQFDKAPLIELDADAFASADLDPDWRGYMSEYRLGVAAAQNELSAVFGVLDAAAGDPGRLEHVADSVATVLPLEGRPLGYFMTAAIRRQLGDAELAATIGDPAAWLQAYGRAARLNACACPDVPAAVLALVGSAPPGN
jgi:hypothetical protein